MTFLGQDILVLQNVLVLKRYMLKFLGIKCRDLLLNRFGNKYSGGVWVCLCVQIGNKDIEKRSHFKKVNKGNFFKVGDDLLESCIYQTHTKCIEKITQMLFTNNYNEQPGWERGIQQITLRIQSGVEQQVLRATWTPTVTLMRQLSNPSFCASSFTFFRAKPLHLTQCETSLFSEAGLTHFLMSE